jgi:hypothetical protein
MDNWIERFQNILETADLMAEAREKTLDTIMAMRLAGIDRDEAFMRIAAELYNSGQVGYGMLYQKFLNEVYGVEVKTS